MWHKVITPLQHKAQGSHAVGILEVLPLRCPPYTHTPLVNLGKWVKGARRDKCDLWIQGVWVNSADGVQCSQLRLRLRSRTDTCPLTHA